MVNHNNDPGASDFYENNLTIALCPKAELDDDCKYFYFMSDLNFHYIKKISLLCINED